MSPALSHSYSKLNNNHKDEVLRGNFPLYEDIRGLKIRKINRLLCVFAVIAVITSMVSYSLVFSTENKISSIHNKISELNYENIELENKLEYVKSFYSVNKKISKTKILDKARKVIEVNEVDRELELSPYRKKLKINSTLGY